MNKNISSKLLSFQINHTLQLYESLKKEKCILDASDTGTGKTYCAIALCKMINKSPLIICPKSVIQTWIDVCKIFDVEIFAIANYEMFKNGKCFIIDKMDSLKPITCDFLNNKGKGKTSEYEFNLPSNIVIIFDEAHRCKNYNTATSKLLLATKKVNNKVILLSATISDKVDCFCPFGILFGLYSNMRQYKAWIRSELFKFSGIEKAREKKIIKNQNLLNILKKNEQFMDLNIRIQDDNFDIIKDEFNYKEPIRFHDYSENTKKIMVIHNLLFPRFGARMKIKELGDLFPQNNIFTQSYYMDNYKEVSDLYNEINIALAELKNKETRAHALGKIIRAKQRIELLKVPIFQDLAEDALENGYSVVIFVNYLDTMHYLCENLKCETVIHGGQTLNERNRAVEEFQSNKSKIIIAILQAGGVGISLHDINGNHPRLSIISPSWSGQDMVQCLGRIHRAGSKSPAIQKIVFCAKTYEEKICSIVEQKIKNLTGINDGDLVGPLITQEKINEFNSCVNDESLYYNCSM